MTGKKLTDATVTLRYGNVPSANITLIITDPLSHDTTTVTRTITVPVGATKEVTP